MTTTTIKTEHRVWYRRAIPNGELRVVTMGDTLYTMSYDLAGRELNDSYHGNGSPHDFVSSDPSGEWEPLAIPYSPAPESVLASALVRRVIWGKLDLGHTDPSPSCFPFAVDHLRVEHYFGSPNVLLVLDGWIAKSLLECASYIATSVDAALLLGEAMVGHCTWDLVQRSVSGFEAARVDREMAAVEELESSLGNVPVLAYDSFPDDERPITAPNSVWYAYARRARCDIRTADVVELLCVLAPPGADSIKYWLWLEGPAIPDLWTKIVLPTSQDWFRSYLTSRSALFLSEDRSSVIAARWVGDGRWAFVALHDADVWSRDSSPQLGATGTVFIKDFSTEGALLSAKALVQ